MQHTLNPIYDIRCLLIENGFHPSEKHTTRIPGIYAYSRGFELSSTKFQITHVATLVHICTKFCLDHDAEIADMFSKYKKVLEDNGYAVTYGNRYPEEKPFTRLWIS